MPKYRVNICGRYIVDDGFESIIQAPNGWDDVQTGQCPDCEGTWVWYEAGFVPGTRKCRMCSSLFNVELQGKIAILRRERFYAGH